MVDMVTEEYAAAMPTPDSRILSLLGAIPEGTDLRALQSDLLAGQVAGYYDPESGDIVVRDDGDGELDVTERLTLAHELDDALTDQALGLPDTDVEGQSDANLAGLALVEGDATLLMQQWALANLGLADQFQQLLDPQVAQAQADLENVPPYLRQELMFPYLNGLSYVCRLFVEGEWPAVDAAYQDPPATTAEVLFPEDAGAAPQDPGTRPRLARAGRKPGPTPSARHPCCGCCRPRGETRPRPSTRRPTRRGTGPVASSPCSPRVSSPRSAWLWSTRPTAACSARRSRTGTRRPSTPPAPRTAAPS